MERRTLMTGIAALLLGGGLVWGADHAGPQGIAGWKTLNAGMEQALDTAQAAEPVPSAAVEGAGAGKTPAAPATVATEGGGTAAASDGAAAQGEGSTAGTININTASIKELMDLPGIGEKKAQAIIDYRNQQGAFRSISDLGKVKGIGPKMLEKLKPLIGF